ncbi:hypothetical protein [Bradyrhizobium japonicum]|uniref:hypothetical protein n=1 Tax=Bradyrhizobium japonicum TaxID=375 RepID=UPI001BA9BD82|nr:hypothetical protein [Bradyrhizobium japonicum]MBR0955900.1 hypothetical protein [Bradyrhizobium japonicum]
MIAAAHVVTTRLENPLQIKGAHTVHGVVFRLFVLAPMRSQHAHVIGAQPHRLTFAHAQHASLCLWKAAGP